MTTLSTHDTKRSADVRARIAVLSEIPDQWGHAVRRWRERADKHGPPDPNIDYLMWQTLVGCWPLPGDRLADYLEKASREAKLETSWTEPNRRYDERLRRYAGAVCADEELMADVGTWVGEHVAGPGTVNALSQRLVQLLMPGVPDIYQGDELPEFSLVDPDNRRPVDYDHRRRLLAAGAEPKLNLVATAARLRRDRPDLVGASYEQVKVSGAAQEHAVAFRRGDDVAVLATRLPVGLDRRGGWGDTTLDLGGEGWRDLLTDRHVSDLTCHAVLDVLPVALLVRGVPPSDEG
jgi:(1->4)-alpha-D-glucan 1-alpha-D-glucosylmutase